MPLNIQDTKIIEKKAYKLNVYEKSKQNILHTNLL